MRNARQAIEATGQPGTIEIAGGEDEADWWIRVGDTGPGLPPRRASTSSPPFRAARARAARALALPSAAELVRGHGGRLDLLRSDEEGTEFMIRLPKKAASWQIRPDAALFVPCKPPARGLNGPARRTRSSAG
jgi:C4-dicarboxylate-specific signal transduction histidine kinase